MPQDKRRLDNMSAWKTVRMITYGFLLGTAGVKLLSSKDAKSAYTHITAGVLRCRDQVVKDATVLKENCGDIVADAKAINAKRAKEEEARQIRDAEEVLKRAEEKKQAAAAAEA